MDTETYSNWASLISAAEKKVSTILETDVAPIVEDTLKKHIQKDIYDVYTPVNGGVFGGVRFKHAYQRRDLPSSVYSYLLDGSTIIATSDATASKPILKNHSWTLRYPGSFLEMLERGNLGLLNKKFPRGFPRPAVSNTQSEVNRDLKRGKISKAIRDGIKREFN